MPVISGRYSTLILDSEMDGDTLRITKKARTAWVASFIFILVTAGIAYGVLSMNGYASWEKLAPFIRLALFVGAVIIVMMVFGVGGVPYLEVWEITPERIYYSARCGVTREALSALRSDISEITVTGLGLDKQDRLSGIPSVLNGFASIYGLKVRFDGRQTLYIPVGGREDSEALKTRLSE